MWQAQQIAAIQLANQMLHAMSAPSNYTLNQRSPHFAYDDNNAAGDASDDEDDEQSRTLYVGNLEDRVTEDLLYEIFLQAGPIESVRIPKDNNGRQRSFGFVVYTHRCTPSYALKLFTGLTLYRKSVTIKLQGETNAGNKRRSLPNECERYGMPRPNDNTMLRSTSYPNFYDSSLNEYNKLSSPISSNPFRTNSPDFSCLTGVGGKNGGNSGCGTSKNYDRGGGRDRSERDRRMDRDRGNNHGRNHPYQRDDRRLRDDGQRKRR
ncbi:RNA-binding protein 7 [Eurosta solidaginis]|uniref:RNA-binding protein 7 n=1 Tax=Eurosta solidaginis TaxID=178769 RepID=UPI003530A441